MLEFGLDGERSFDGERGEGLDEQLADALVEADDLRERAYHAAVMAMRTNFYRMRISLSACCRLNYADAATYVRYTGITAKAPTAPCARAGGGPGSTWPGGAAGAATGGSSRPALTTSWTRATQ